jgi:hypothetical protein
MIIIIKIYTNRLKQRSAGYWVSKIGHVMEISGKCEFLSRENESMFGMNLGGW